nr:uncharacterized protein CI109_002665 [Kwoniella shandongensis]KAA5528908.1 hypothetical protein CI109_002665 [Kwoniella shandongensis]
MDPIATYHATQTYSLLPSPHADCSQILDEKLRLAARTKAAQRDFELGLQRLASSYNSSHAQLQGFLDSIRYETEQCTKPSSTRKCPRSNREQAVDVASPSHCYRQNETAMEDRPPFPSDVPWILMMDRYLSSEAGLGSDIWGVKWDPKHRLRSRLDPRTTDTSHRGNGESKPEQSRINQPSDHSHSESSALCATPAPHDDSGRCLPPTPDLGASSHSVSTDDIPLLEQMDIGLVSSLFQPRLRVDRTAITSRSDHDEVAHPAHPDTPTLHTASCHSFNFKGGSDYDSELSDSGSAMTTEPQMTCDLMWRSYESTVIEEVSEVPPEGYVIVAEELDFESELGDDAWSVISDQSEK